MKGLIASSLAALMMVAALGAPALGEPVKKTELVARDGAHVDKLQLRNDFDGVWVIDALRILYRDERRDYYLVTLAEPCPTLEIRSRSFSFQPAWSWQLRTNFSYEVRPTVGRACDVAKIEQIDAGRASPLREAAHHRVW